MHELSVRPRAVRFAALLLASWLLLLLPARQATAAEESEASFRSLMNAERVERGRGTLKMGDYLVRVARQHSRRMAASGGIYHNSHLADDLRPIQWSIAGENVGVGNTVETLHDAFMDSAPHRENILRRSFERVGVGVVTADGRIWVTFVFAG